jgi:hypothetical protein
MRIPFWKHFFVFFTNPSSTVDITVLEIFETITLAARTNVARKQAQRSALTAAIEIGEETDDGGGDGADSDVSFRPTHSNRKRSKLVKVTDVHPTRTSTQVSRVLYTWNSPTLNKIIQFLKYFYSYGGGGGGSDIQSRFTLAHLLQTINIISHLTQTRRLWRFIKFIIETVVNECNPSTQLIDSIYEDALQEIRFEILKNETIEFNHDRMRAFAEKLAQTIKSEVSRPPSMKFVSDDRYLTKYLTSKEECVSKFIRDLVIHEKFRMADDKPTQFELDYEINMGSLEFDMDIDIKKIIHSALNNIFFHTFETYYISNCKFDLDDLNRHYNLAKNIKSTNIKLPTDISTISIIPTTTTFTNDIVSVTPSTAATKKRKTAAKSTTT